MAGLKIRKGDKVRVLSGREKGKGGEVLKVFPRKGKILIGGINKVKKHLKSREGSKGGIAEIERPLLAGKVGLVCQSCQKVTRPIRALEGGKKVRLCGICQTKM